MQLCVQREGGRELCFILESTVCYVCVYEAVFIHVALEDVACECIRVLSIKSHGTLP